MKEIKPHKMHFSHIVDGKDVYVKKRDKHRLQELINRENVKRPTSLRSYFKCKPRSVTWR